jgi:hypothetical protein
MISKIPTSHYIAVTLLATPLASVAGGPSGPWTPSAGLSAKESFDSNVYLQSTGPRANKDSFLTTILPAMGMGYKPSEVFSATLSYSPEINIFHSASGEDFTTHRITLAASGKAEHTRWEINNNFAAVDGSDTGAIYPTMGGGATAGGGPQAMLRRDMFVERGQARLSQNFGKWFLRPVVSGFLFDFRIQKKTTLGYQNLVDRNELAAGVDVGYSIFKNTSLVAGYRYGIQNQAQLFPSLNPIHYDSTFHRPLFGIEGSPCKWIQLNVSFGPEFRTYDGVLTPGTDKDQEFIYSDSSITLLPSRRDTVMLSAKRFQQPGFSGRSAYTDATYDGSWKHRFGEKFTLGIGARAYNTDFIQPIKRDDWIYTGYGIASYTFNEHLSSEISYSYDSAASRYSNTPAREYTRSLVALGVKYVFK